MLEPSPAHCIGIPFRHPAGVPRTPGSRFEIHREALPNSPKVFATVSGFIAKCSARSTKGAFLGCRKCWLGLIKPHFGLLRDAFLYFALIVSGVLRGVSSRPIKLRACFARVSGYPGAT